MLASHQSGITADGLDAQESSGNGSVSTVSLFDVAIGSLGNQAGDYLMSGNVPGRLGTLHPGISPYGDCFTCSDGRQIVLAVAAMNSSISFVNCAVNPNWLLRNNLLTIRLA
ncbi:MAG: CoA transferase [Bacteroidia bacterium]